MSRRVRFSADDLTRAALLAKAQGVGVRLGRDGSILILPEPPRLDITTGDDLDDELAAWEQRRGDRGRA